MSDLISYKPPGPVVQQFHLSQAPVRVLLGPLGSGKTTACCFEVFIKACAQMPYKGVRKSRWLVVRNTYPELISTTINSWTQWFDQRMGPLKTAPPITHRWNFPLGDGTSVEAEIIFMALDGPDADAKIRGLELTGAWLNECREISKPIWDMLDGRIGRFPPKAWAGGPTWTGIIADTNMPDDDHFLYRFAEVETPETWEFFRQPGGLVRGTPLSDGKTNWTLNETAENLHNLPQNYYVRQKHGKSDDWTRVYLGAEYGYVSEGRPVFPEFKDDAHTAQLEPVQGLPIFLGADWGLTPAAVIVQQAPNGQIVVLGEVVTEGIGAKNFATQIKRELAKPRYSGLKIGGMWGDPAGSVRVQTDEQTVFQIMRAEGLPFKPAPVANTDTVVRREAVARPLTRMIDGRPGMLVDKAASVLRAGLAGKFCYKRMRVSGERYQDKPEKNNEWSHVCEALEYVCLGLGEGKAVMTDQYQDRQTVQRPPVITGSKRHHRAGRFAAKARY